MNLPRETERALLCARFGVDEHEGIARVAQPPVEAAAEFVFLRDGHGQMAGGLAEHSGVIGVAEPADVYSGEIVEEHQAAFVCERCRRGGRVVDDVQRFFSDTIRGVGDLNDVSVEVVDVDFFLCAGIIGVSEAVVFVVAERPAVAVGLLFFPVGSLVDGFHAASDEPFGVEEERIDVSAAAFGDGHHDAGHANAAAIVTLAVFEHGCRAVVACDGSHAAVLVGLQCEFADLPGQSSGEHDARVDVGACSSVVVDFVVAAARGQQCCNEHCEGRQSPAYVLLLLLIHYHSLNVCEGSNWVVKTGCKGTTSY